MKSDKHIKRLTKKEKMVNHILNLRYIDYVCAALSCKKVIDLDDFKLFPVRLNLSIVRSRKRVVPGTPTNVRVQKITSVIDFNLKEIESF